MTAVDYFVRELQRRGVTSMATLCGHGLDPLFHAARRAGIRLIDTRNEQTAGYVAFFQGRLSRKPGVCCVSSGVAHINALTGVGSAWFDSTPMLLVSGAGAHRTAGMGHFQDFDQVGLARTVTKYARVIDCPERTLQILDEALNTAVAAPPGPVHLTFPMDIQDAEVDELRLIRTMSPMAAEAPLEDPEPLARTLAASSCPLLVAGGGVQSAGGGEALIRFAERFSIPTVVPIWDKGSIDHPAEMFMGVIGAATGGPRLLPDADCVIMAGAMSDYRVGFLQAGAVAANAAVHHRLAGWDRLSVACDKAGVRPFASWLEAARGRREAFRAGIRRKGDEQAKAGMHAVHIIDALKQVLTGDTVFLIDGGSIGQWAHQLLCDRYPAHWITCGRSGVIGWSIAGGMAARLSFPERPVILLTGDGAFTFNVAEIECAVRQSLHFVAVIADDQGWGITRTGHMKQFGESIASSLGPIEMDKLAESLGARGVKASRPEEIAPAIRRALAEPAVTVIQVPIVGGNPA